MSIADKLTLLNNTKQEIKSAIEAKGYVIGDIPFSQYPSVINAMDVTEYGDLFQLGQSLNFDFINQRYGTKSLDDGSVNYTTNVNDLGILTRASTGTYWGPSGTLLEAAVDEARIQHDPVTGEALGVLVESEATNNIANNTYRGVNGATVTQVLDDPTFPSAMLHVSELSVAENSSLGVGCLSYEYPSGTSGATWNRIFVHSGYARYFGFGGTVPSDTLLVDFQNIEESDNVRPVGGGWYELTFNASSEGGTGGRRFRFSFGNALSSGRILWAVGDEALIAYPQQEGSSVDYSAGYRSSVIPTVDSPVTRAADEVSIDLSDVFNPDEGTLKVTAQVREGEVVATLGGIDILSDSDERKEYTLTHGDSVSDSELTLGDGVFERVEYYPEVLA